MSARDDHVALAHRPEQWAYNALEEIDRLREIVAAGSSTREGEGGEVRPSGTPGVVHTPAATQFPWQHTGDNTNYHAWRGVCEALDRLRSVGVVGVEESVPGVLRARSEWHQPL